MTKLYQAIARRLIACDNCAKPDANPRQKEWFSKHKEAIEKMVKNHMPCGSGFDNGTKIDFLKSRANRLVFTTSFHHMDDSGGYDGWTHHTVVIKPSLTFDIDIIIGGRDRNDIKSYIYDTFQGALESHILE